MKILMNFRLSCLLGIWGVMMSLPFSMRASGVESGCVKLKWYVSRIFPQKSFAHSVPAGNYSGITHIYDDVYAVVSDKADSTLFFIFKIEINEQGNLEKAENLGCRVMVNGILYDGQRKNVSFHGCDHEAIAKVSDTTVVVASEGNFSMREYEVNPLLNMESQPEGHQMMPLWELKWNPSMFYSNYSFESLAFDSEHQCLWTIPESMFSIDGIPASPQNRHYNRLRLVRLDWQKMKLEKSNSFIGMCACPLVTYVYQMDEPSTNRKAEIYALGVSELCTLPDGQLLVLEREAFVPKIKIGAFCKCKIYIVNPWEEQGDLTMVSSVNNLTPLRREVPILKKRLLVEWKTSLSVFNRSFANYEGMCLGPRLKDGSQVLILLSDSQGQYAGFLKDWFRTIVIRSESSDAMKK